MNKYCIKMLIKLYILGNFKKRIFKKLYIKLSSKYNYKYFDLEFLKKLSEQK